MKPQNSDSVNDVVKQAGKKQEFMNMHILPATAKKIVVDVLLIL